VFFCFDINISFSLTCVNVIISAGVLFSGIGLILRDFQELDYFWRLMNINMLENLTELAMKQA
jgi:hypothetical protein